MYFQEIRVWELWTYSFRGEDTESSSILLDGHAHLDKEWLSGHDTRAHTKQNKREKKASVFSFFEFWPATLVCPTSSGTVTSPVELILFFSASPPTSHLILRWSFQSPAATHTHTHQQTGQSVSGSGGGRRHTSSISAASSLLIFSVACASSPSSITWSTGASPLGCDGSASEGGKERAPGRKPRKMKLTYSEQFKKDQLNHQWTGFAITLVTY